MSSSTAFGWRRSAETPLRFNRLARLRVDDFDLRMAGADVLLHPFAGRIRFCCGIGDDNQAWISKPWLDKTLGKVQRSPSRI